MDTAKITTVDPKSIISIKISGAFLGRLNKFLNDYSAVIGEDEFIAELLEIKNYYEDNIDSLTEKSYNLETIITLVRCIEQEFKKQGLTDVEKIDYELTSSEKKEVSDTIDEIKSNISDR